jgi:hypothetical protein
MIVLLLIPVYILTFGDLSLWLSILYTIHFNTVTQMLVNGSKIYSIRCKHMKLRIEMLIILLPRRLSTWIPFLLLCNLKR